MTDKRCTFKRGQWNCGSYQFNLYKDDIDQGDLCDVHYWQTKAQRQWVGLTDEEIRDCLGPEAVRIPPGWSRLTRAIEAKLKEKNT
jgi:hypothetical protein